MENTIHFFMYSALAWVAIIILFAILFLGVRSLIRFLKKSLPEDNYYNLQQNDDEWFERMLKRHETRETIRNKAGMGLMK